MTYLQPETPTSDRRPKLVDQKDQSFEIDLSSFPTTRYQGSKRKILSWIWEHLEPIAFDSVLDAFGGTGCVSYLFKRAGKRVDYNDYMRWNYLVGTALIENEAARLTSEDIKMLTEPVTTDDPGFVSTTFRGIYFTDRENLWIDAILRRTKQLRGAGNAKRLKQAAAFYALSQTCLIKRPFNLFHRANLDLRMRKVERTFGNKKTWDTPFAQHFSKFATEINQAAFNSGRPCRSLNFDALEIPEQQYDLVYIDPPYLKAHANNESSNYLASYHFLEGLSREKEWSDLINFNSRTLGFKAKSPNPWVDPLSNIAAFNLLIEKYRNSVVVISYKKFGIPSVQTLVRMLQRHGKRVRVRSRHYKYALNSQNGHAALNRECLIIAE